MSRITATLFLTALSALAQFDSAAVVGSIRDEKGGALSGAKLVLRNNDTGSIQSATTSDLGPR